MGVIFDLDQTIVDSSIAAQLRIQRNWQKVYAQIPSFVVYEGILEVLDFLNFTGIETAIVSTSPRPYCQKVVQHIKIKCDHIVGYHDARPNKPHAAPMLKALKMMNMKASQVISVGDRVIDIESSRNAGIASIGCMWGSDEKDLLTKSNPEYLVSTPLEIIPIIKQFFHV